MTTSTEKNCPIWVHPKKGKLITKTNMGAWCFGLLALFLILLSPQVWALDRGSPEDTVRNFLNAFKDGRYAEACGFLDQEVLSQAHQMILRGISLVEKHEPEEVNQLLAMFKGVQSLNEVKKLDAPHFFESLMAAILDEKPDVKLVLSRMTVKVIGSVAETDVLQHVVTKVMFAHPFRGQKEDLMSMPVRKNGDGGWSILFEGDIGTHLRDIEKRYKAIEEYYRRQGRN